jgi:hypothetical protein
MPMDKSEDQLYIIRPGDEGKGVLAVMLAFVAACMESHAIEVIVRAYVKTRTDLQNRFLHGWIFRLQIMKKLNDAGIQIDLPDGSKADFDVDILKEVFKHDCIIEQIVEIKRFVGPDGKIHKTEVHPSKFNKADFAKYCDLVMFYAHFWYGIEVEQPISGQWLAIYKEIK